MIIGGIGRRGIYWCDSAILPGKVEIGVIMFNCKIFESEVRDFGGFYRIERVGQQNPSDGDGVQAVASVFLPCVIDGGDRVLAPELRYGQRLKLCDEDLIRTWGYYAGNVCGIKIIVPPLFRARSAIYRADTWKGCFATGIDWAEKNLDMLASDLAVRKRALERAEWSGP